MKYISASLTLAAALVASFSVVVPADAAIVVTTGASDTTDPSTSGGATDSVVIVSPLSGAVIMGAPPVSVTIKTEAMSDMVGAIEVLVDGALVGSCAAAICDVAVDLEVGAHTADAVLYDVGMFPLAQATPVGFEVQEGAATGGAETSGGTTEGTTGGGSTGGGGTEGGTEGGTDDKGCGCSQEGARGAAPLGLALLVLLPLVRRRRA